MTLSLDTNLTEHPTLKGFYEHPEFRHIYVNQTGDVFNTRTNKPLEGGIDEYNIKRVNIGGMKINVFRLITDIFVPKPKGISGDKLILDFKDNDTTNKSLNNLYWRDITDFKLHPTIPNLALNKEGLCCNLKSRNMLKGWVHTEREDGGIWVHIGQYAYPVTRLIAETFLLESEDNTKDKILYYIDGNTGNIDPSNLIWLDLNDFYQHPTIPNLKVSKDGKFYNTNTKRIVYGFVRGNNEQHSIIINKEFRLAYKLVAETFIPKPGDIADDNLSLYHIDGNLNNTELSNLKWIDVSEFKPHPTYTDIMVHPDGIVRNSRTGNILYGYADESSGGYIKVWINGGYKKVHRLVCETFLKKPIDISEDKIVVNHLDGNKLNNRLDNLEWTDYSGNTNHAYDNDLHTTNIPVLVQDLELHTITEYRSVMKAAEAIGIKHNSLHKYLSTRYSRAPIKGKFIVTFKGTDMPDIEYAKLKARSNRNEIYLIQKPDSKSITIVEGVKNAGYIVGVSDINISRYVKKLKELEHIDKNINYITINGYKLYTLYTYPKYLKEYQEFKTAYENRIRSKNTNSGFQKGNTYSQPSPVKVTDVETKTNIVFPSVHDTAIKYGVSDKSIYHILKSNKIWRGNLKVEYAK